MDGNFPDSYFQLETGNEYCNVLVDDAGMLGQCCAQRSRVGIIVNRRSDWNVLRPLDSGPDQLLVD